MSSCRINSKEMAASKSYSDVLKGSINTKFKPVVMEIFESHKFSEWAQFRNIAIEILNHAQKLKLPLKLDNLTFGNGSCFMISILQQCHRPDIEIYLPDHMINISKNYDTDKFRCEVSNFMLSSGHPAVIEYKERYEKYDMRILKKTWIEHWNHMKKKNIWADGHFVQGTAFYLGIDIWIVSTKSKEDNPYIKICSNLENPNTAGIAPPLIVGLKGDCHYQSFIPLERGIFFPKTKGDSKV